MCLVLLSAFCYSWEQDIGDVIPCCDILPVITTQYTKNTVLIGLNIKTEHCIQVLVPQNQKPRISTTHYFAETVI